MSKANRRYLVGCLLTILFYGALFLIAATPPTEVPYHCDVRGAC